MRPQALFVYSKSHPDYVNKANIYQLKFNYIYLRLYQIKKNYNNIIIIRYFKINIRLHLIEWKNDNIEFFFEFYVE